jgi:hypothetical protein
VNSSGQFNYFFRKSPVFRTFCLIALLLLITAACVFAARHLRRAPVIGAVNPPVGSPGDVVIITGKDFGNARDTGYVEFGGSRLTASSYISWTDTEIKVVLPANVQDGLVIVGNDIFRSKPAFFANEREIPVPVRANPQTSVPFVSAVMSVSAASAIIKPKDEIFSPGDVIVITGNNFGNSRDTSEVCFASDREISQSSGAASSPAASVPDPSLNHISANSADYDYEYWSDTEIRVHIPDGAVTGMVYIVTPKGKSSQQKITISPKTGSKKFSSRRTYLIQLSADIADASSAKSAMIRLLFPRPLLSSSQPLAQMTEAKPDPAINDYQNTVIHQVQAGKSFFGKKQFSQNFVVSVYEVATDIHPDALLPYSRMNQMLYAAAVHSDKCVPSGDHQITALAKSITGKETNAYRRAQLLYSYMLDNYRLSSVKSDSSSPLDLVRNKKGDAYDFAIVYTALLRASGIPALPDCGILVDRDLKTRSHWWCEFYLAGFGWVPADPALGSGLSYKSWTETGDPRTYYFGNLDSQHITFSRGWNEIKPGAGDSKIVQRPRGYALQSIWEESSRGTIRYSSFWADPVILGVY